MLAPALPLTLSLPRVEASLRAAVWVSVAYFLISCALEVAAALHCPLEYTADFLYDDAYYYLGVAEHLARGEGSTFRAPLHTNGYQPLWLLLLAGIAWAFQLGTKGLFVATIALTFATKITAILCARRTTALALVVCIGWMQFVFSLGLETTMLALAVPVLPWLLSTHSPWSGLVFAGLFLVRLDAAALFFAFALWRIVSERRVDRVLLLQGAILVLVAAVYFALNWSWFGVPVPVSGLAKQLGNVPGENVVVHSFERPLAVCALLAVVHELVRRKLGAPRDALDRVAGVLGLTGVITIAYYTLASGWRVWPWYNWPLALCFVFLFARSLKMGLDTSSTPLGRALLAGLAALALWLGLQGLGANKSDTLAALAAHHAPQYADIFPIIPSFNKDSVRMIERMFQREGQTIVMGDRAGGLGYWLPPQHRFLHSEGLVGDAAFLRARAKGEGEAFVDSFDPDLLIVDRDRLLTEGNTYGVAEPIQGSSMHAGVMLFCFPAEAIRDQRALPLGYGSWYTVRTRYTFDYRARTACSTGMQARLQALLDEPEALRDFSMASER